MIGRMTAILGLMLAALLLFGAAPAAAGGPYFGGFGGGNLTLEGGFGSGRMSYKPGVAVGTYGGYAFDLGLRLGGGITLRINETNEFNGTNSQNQTLYSYAFMANAFYDFNNPTIFIPYVGGGVGFAAVEFQDNNENNDTDVVPAFEVGAGVALALGRIVRLTLDYRYFITMDAELDIGFGPFDLEYSNHSAMFGVRIQF